MPDLTPSSKRRPRHVPPPRRWSSLDEMPEYGITLHEAALFLGSGFGYQTLRLLCKSGSLADFLKAQDLWEPGMIVRRGSRWSVSRSFVATLALHGQFAFPPQRFRSRRPHNPPNQTPR